VRALVDAALDAGVEATYREIESDKGHDAFLVEWDQLNVILAEVLDGIRRRAEDREREERVAASA
jgi:homoserine acetyltransferase